jgi:hypothetical protein
VAAKRPPAGAEKRDNSMAVGPPSSPLHMCVKSILSTALARSRHPGHNRKVSTFVGRDYAHLLRCLSAYVPSPALTLLKTGTAVTPKCPCRDAKCYDPVHKVGYME